MVATDLQDIANKILHRAQRQGFVVAQDVREELSQAGLLDSLWKDVLALARPSLYYRQGRYFFSPPVSDRVRKEQKQLQHIHRAVRQIIRAHRKRANPVERRRQERVDFVQPVKVRAADDHEFTLLTRDLSPQGIRLIGTRHLLGQKIRVQLPGGEGKGPHWFHVRIVWTCAISEELFESGGSFLDVDDE
jgi:hypothetical protein